MIIDRLVESERLWPLLPHNPCRLCGLPRRAEWAKDWAICYGCKQLRDLYGEALADVYPITLTMRDWPLGAGLRDWKDRHDARPNTRHALGFGAVLSAYLEAQLATRGLGTPWGFGVIAAVPSSKPAVAGALARARTEGWWAPELVGVAVAREGVPRQRERPGGERLRVENKWLVDAAAVADQDVLLLDDLYTSGGSVHSLALALRRAGAHSVRAVVLARNVGADDADWILPLLRERRADGARWHPAQRKRETLP